MHASTSFALRSPAAWLAGFGLATAFALAGAATTLAAQGGNPVDQRTISEALAAERAGQSAERAVVPAAAPGEPRWHDKSEEQWRAYHQYDREWKERNVRR